MYTQYCMYMYIHVHTCVFIYTYMYSVQNLTKAFTVYIQ